MVLASARPLPVTEIAAEAGRAPYPLPGPGRRASSLLAKAGAFTDAESEESQAAWRAWPSSDRHEVMTERADRVVSTLTEAFADLMAAGHAFGQVPHHGAGPVRVLPRLGVPVLR